MLKTLHYLFLQIKYRIQHFKSSPVVEVLIYIVIDRLQGDLAENINRLPIVLSRRYISSEGALILMQIICVIFANPVYCLRSTTNLSTSECDFSNSFLFINDEYVPT